MAWPGRDEHPRGKPSSFRPKLLARVVTWHPPSLPVRGCTGPPSFSSSFSIFGIQPTRTASDAILTMNQSLPEPEQPTRSSQSARQPPRLPAPGGHRRCHRRLRARPPAHCCLTRRRVSPTTSTDVDAEVLNFALNLEYLEAEYYCYAVYGKSIEDQFGVGAPSGVGGAAGTLTVKIQPAGAVLEPRRGFVRQGNRQRRGRTTSRSCARRWARGGRAAEHRPAQQLQHGLRRGDEHPRATPSTRSRTT